MRVNYIPSSGNSVQGAAGLGDPCVPSVGGPPREPSPVVGLHNETPTRNLEFAESRNETNRLIIKLYTTLCSR